jgi:hypothetical protein
VPIPGDHLRGGHGGETEVPAHVRLHARVHVGVGAHRTAQLADGHGRARLAQTLTVPVGLQAPQRDLRPHRGGLGVHAVRAADHDGVGKLERASFEHRHEHAARIDQLVGHLHEHAAQRGVDDVGGGEAVVDPRAPAGAPMDACTTSTNAATSWSVIRSRSFTARTNAASTCGARSRHAAACSAGTTPSSANASVASSSTSSHDAILDWSVQREARGSSAYLGINGGPSCADVSPRAVRCPSARSPG